MVLPAVTPVGQRNHGNKQRIERQPDKHDDHHCSHEIISSTLNGGVHQVRGELGVMVFME